MEIYTCIVGIRGNVPSSRERCLVFPPPRFFDLRIVRYSKLSGTGSKSYDGVFNYRVNNELNFRGLKLDSFEEIFERKRNQDIFLLQFNLSFSKISFFFFFFIIGESY